MRILWQCEIDDFCRKVLNKHWPEVPKHGDIRQLHNPPRPDVIVGGFPCQPYSKAGKQKGRDDDRHLWPEMLRIIGEVRPNWVVGENVENLLRMELDNICGDLERINYTARSFVVSAYCSGAWYDGKRIFVVASANNRSAALRRNTQFQSDDKTQRSKGDNRGRTQKLDPGKRWPEQSRPYGMADGVPDRVDRLKCLGNAVNPYQIYPILAAISEIEGQVRG